MNNKVSDDLLNAADRQPAILERRQSSKRRVKRDRRRGIRRSVGLDISPSGIAIAVLEKSGEDAKLIVQRIAFPADSGPTRGDWNDSTLLDSLTEIAAKYNLGGQAVSVGLGGTPCVTRVVAGDNDHVDNEITELAGRTQRYIGMGLGEKVSCETSTPIDAKRKRVCVTIAMREVVDAVASAIDSAGMRLVHLEHTMLVLCRILHAYEKDSEEPVLMIVDELGRLDLGISYQGRLLLDYRPAIPDASSTEGSIVQRHLKCLRRYIQAQLPNLSTDLSKIYVTGTQTEHASLHQSFDQQSSLRRCHFPLKELCDGLDLQGEVTEHPGILSAIGSARLAKDAAFEDGKNDLVSTLHSSRRVQWIPLARQIWPIAFAASIALVLLFFGNHSRQLATRTETQIETLRTQHAEGNQIRLTLQRRMQRSRQVEALDRSIVKPQWAKVFWKAGMSLPEGTWLESIQIDKESNVRIVGSSHATEGVYEYLDRLRQTGVFSRVALESTHATRSSVGPEFKFEVSAYLDTRTAQKHSNGLAISMKRSSHSG